MFGEVKNFGIGNVTPTNLSEADYIRYQQNLLSNPNIPPAGTPTSPFLGNEGANPEEKYVFNNCNKRWWKLKVNEQTPLPERIYIPSYGYSITKAEFLLLPGNIQSTAMYPNPANPSQLIPLNYGINQSGTTWVSWDAVTQQWLTMSIWETCPEIPPDGPPGDPIPVDECATYGINCPEQMSSGKVYTLIDNADKLPIRRIKTTSGIWLDPSGSVIGNMLTYHTCSAQPTSSYNRTVYQTICDSCGAEPHFDIVYGHDGGSGSKDSGGYDRLTQTNAIYGQYRSLCLNPGTERFTMGEKEMYHFYVINVNRERMGDRLDEGHVELNLHQLSGSQFLTGNGNRNAHTGSNVKLGAAGNIIRLIDDSRLNYSLLNSNAMSYHYSDLNDERTHRVNNGGEYHYIVSGNLETGTYNSTNPRVYGLSFPRLGVILLDADALDVSASFLTVTGSDIAGYNSDKLLKSMSGSALYTDDSGDYLGFQARKIKYEYLEQYFVRVKNFDYNFTNNPTYQTGSLGQIISDFQLNHKVYITSVGMYNSNRECLAVGKLSHTVMKSYTTEALFNVKIKY